MRTELLDELEMLQDPSGGFPSHITSSKGSTTDVNGFVTATVLRTLRHLPFSRVWGAICERALDFCMSCRTRHAPDAFAFWPERSRPAWASRVPADVDDTAVMLSELLRHGRVDRPTALRSVCKALLPCRVKGSDIERLPPWVVPGSFFTWIPDPAMAPGASRRVTNIVDCCVNVNVVALMSQLDARHLPGFDAAVQTVRNAVAWSDDDERRHSAVTPFYPSRRNLADATQHAVECGADALDDVLVELTSPRARSLPVVAGACRSAYGTTVWHSHAIDVARHRP